MSIAATMRKQATIALLKAKAKRLYVAYHKGAGDMSCGIHLAEFIRPSLCKLRVEFNETMTQLAKLDPEAKALIEKMGPL